MFTTNMVWHETAVELPAKTGEYITVTDSGRVRTLPYSSVHKAFNAHDRDDKDDARDWEIPCKLWAEIPKELTEDE